jgi:hypothetical protein
MTNEFASHHQPPLSLREALEKARDALPASEDEARKLIQALLDQQSEEYGTLVDECEIAIFG